ncbi:hypothetical protein NliqN6_6433 [Naganishia liquefaciens]|uniref:DUF7082 domain-containing protein n=1 Tax=Naganishia liquefaciens TaxID=104408 RepID=A0A8H3TYL7_9TREE|nr:hypothetical protein NliqN6_6433 [Naganishia liquefaciens]
MYTVAVAQPGPPPQHHLRSTSTIFHPAGNIGYLGPPCNPQHSNVVVRPPPPDSYSAPVTPITSGWPSQQLSRMSQEPNPTSNPFPSPGIAAQETGMIHVISMSHTYGNEGCPLSVRVNVDFLPSPAPSPVNGIPPQDPGNKTLRIRLGPLPISTKLGDVAPIKTPNGGERYENLVMSAEVPSLLALLGQKPVEGNISFEVFVEVLDVRGNILDSKLAGTFMYTVGPNAQVYDPGLSAANTLKRPGEPLFSDRASPAAQSMRRSPYDHPSMGPSPAGSQVGSAERLDYSARYPSGPGSGAPQQNAPGPISYPGHPTSAAPPWTPTSGGLQDNEHPTPPQPQPLQHSNSGNSSNGSASNTNSNNNVNLHSNNAALQPSLMRTSQLTANSANYNPYAGGNSKAKLELQSDLNLMAVGWDQEEWHAKRRLVQFWRRQDGSIIHAAFRPIKQTEYIPNSIVVSCIYRADKNECFVTSVDAIYLLEALVGLRFSVEEKNRIRRNLEGFRPITVSKNKSGAEDFFKLVMSFPNPKPRNIEKDVKVFPWSIFGTALKKIIGKYSASYVLPPNGNMGPPQPPGTEQSGSPAPPPYNVPSPLLPIPKSEHPGNFNGYPAQLPTPTTGNIQQHPNAGNGAYFEPIELFSPAVSANGGPANGMAQIPSASSSFNGNSGSGNIPTLNHPAPSPGPGQGGPFVPMARQLSGQSPNGYSSGPPVSPQHQAVQHHQSQPPSQQPYMYNNDNAMQYVPPMSRQVSHQYSNEMGPGQHAVYK